MAMILQVHFPIDLEDTQAFYWLLKKKKSLVKHIKPKGRILHKITQAKNKTQMNIRKPRSSLWWKSKRNTMGGYVLAAR